MEIVVWRSLGMEFTQQLVGSGRFAKVSLAWVMWLEDRLPRFAGRIGQYPMFLIHKRKASGV